LFLIARYAEASGGCLLIDDVEVGGVKGAKCHVRLGLQYEALAESGATWQ
jgi:hypothetical protein